MRDTTVTSLTISQPGAKARINLVFLEPSEKVKVHVTINEQIEHDVRCLDSYFRELFKMAQIASLHESSTEKTSEISGCFIAYDLSRFIRPDMVCNVFSLVDFWLPKLCRFHESKHKLTLSHRDIKGTSDLDAYHKYLTKVALLSLHGIQSSYDYLDNLRLVRNCVIHSGGHVKDDQQRPRLEHIQGITVSISLVDIADSFVWDSLKHAKTYLCGIAQA